LAVTGCLSPDGRELILVVVIESGKVVGESLKKIKAAGT
jgi:hypothetical protein